MRSQQAIVPLVGLSLPVTSSGLGLLGFALGLLGFALGLLERSSYLGIKTLCKGFKIKPYCLPNAFSVSAIIPSSAFSAQ